MMSDMSFLTPSAWLCDAPLIKDGVLPEIGGMSALPFDTLDFWGAAPDTQSLSSWDCDVPNSYQNSEISVANSDCSDEYSVDIDGDLEDALLHTISNHDNTDFLSAAAVSTQPEFTETCDYPASYEYNKDWSDDSEDDIWDPITSTEGGSSPQTRERTLSDVLQLNLQWSSLSDEQQLHLVEDLSTIVSQELGLREQLDIIRIINPDASVSPTDREFVIDLSCLDNNKLEQVCVYLRQHTANNNHHHDNTTSRSRSTHHHGNQARRHDTNRCDHESDSESNSSRQSRKTRKRVQKLTHRRRSSTKQKRARQQLKEQRSGLFAKEQILAVESAAGEELDDVDILT